MLRRSCGALLVLAAMVVPSMARAQHAFPHGVKVKYDRFSDSTLVGSRSADLSSAFSLSLRSAELRAAFRYPGRVYLAPPPAVAIVVTFLETSDGSSVHSPRPLGDMIFLLDDSTRLRYPVVPVDADANVVAVSGTVMTNSREDVAAAVPLADYRAIAAAKKVEIQVMDFHAKLGSSPMDELRAVASALAADSAAAK